MASGAGQAGSEARAAGVPPEVELRVGLGVDAHRFAPERPLVLGGVRLRERDGLAGHSDADALLHAVIDALLGAAGLEDIGHLFPDTDPAFAGADSRELLRVAAARVVAAGWQVVNVDAVVVCQEPKIAPYREAMRAAMAEAAGVAVERVNLRGKTTEGMGFAGRGEGIAAEAVALLRRNR